MAEHILKTWPEYWDAVQRGDKTFEVRKDDRGYAVGDVLILQRWCPTDGYTMPAGARVEARRVVTSILRGGRFGVEPGHVVMSIKEK
ncbi:MAG: DUF3850 domain-containing protein [Pseudomonadota bacterium]